MLPSLTQLKLSQESSSCRGASSRSTGGSFIKVTWGGCADDEAPVAIAETWPPSPMASWSAQMSWRPGPCLCRQEEQEQRLVFGRCLDWNSNPVPAGCWRQIPSDQ
eukprot:1328464-Amphidinium_carterae.4